MTYYKIFNHGQNRMSGLYSVNRVGADGRYIEQIAFWFKSAKEASDRADRIVAEDARMGRESAVLAGVAKF